MTIGSDHRPADSEVLKHQALEWLVRLSSGRVTEADAEALRRWCAESSAHAEAFAEANLLWGVLGPSTRNVVARAGAQDDGPTPRQQAMLGRRAFLGGTAAAASVAAAGYLIVRPPLGLWPSASEWMAEYRTATGEQRRVATAGGTAVEMNTQTSLNIGPAANDADRIVLIAGEAVVTTGETAARPVIVVAAEGRISASGAKFDVRRDGLSVCVTCLDGSVNVEHGDALATVREKEQVAYGNGGIGQIASVDPAVVTSWRKGVLIFRGELLAQAVDEINRYRPGRIVLVDAGLGRKRIDASFRLDHVEEIVPQIQHVFGARVRILPGGLVLLG